MNRSIYIVGSGDMSMKEMTPTQLTNNEDFTLTRIKDNGPIMTGKQSRRQRRELERKNKRIK